ncbi:MAG: TIGR00725 family protein [Firmicutes bacterium]|nr:TIGR00725 family protein [Bacillota bacterium]
MGMYYIAVVGGSQCDAALAALAEEVGTGIATRGGILVCGGGSGIMEAASRGARSAGGVVLGILPGEDPRRGNRYLTLAVATGLGEARNAVIARTADALIAVGGEYGTLSEVALALKMGKPVVGLKTWKIEPPQELDRGIIHCETAAEAVEAAWKAATTGWS